MLGIMNGCVYKLWLCVSVKDGNEISSFSYQKKKKKKEGWLRFKHDNVKCGNILKIFLCLVRGGKE